MLARVASLLLRLGGWRTVCVPSPGPKSVVVVYPHTSNWDFIIGMLWRTKHQVTLHWAGKDTLFRGPFRRLFIRLGGVPINRRERTGMIAQLVAIYTARATFHLCITPEGTRSRTDHWKSGFYRLALAADVPVGLGFIDFARKEAGIERWVRLSGDEAADLALLRNYYAGKQGCRPELAGDIRFKR